jgi:hypothetical protein
MKRIGIQWDLQRKDGQRYFHISFFVESPKRERTLATVAAVIAIALFVGLVVMFPDVDTKPTIDVIGGLR